MIKETEKKIAIAKRLASLPEAKQQLLTERLSKEGIDVWQLPIVTTPENQSPLSFAQQRLWFIDQAEPGSTAYNLFFGLCLHGDLSIHWLQASLNEIINRHDILRVRISEQDGVGYQEIRPSTPLIVDVLTVDSELSDEDVDSQLLAIAQQHADKPFDLANDLLFRFQLIKINETYHVGFFTIHHIVFDAWSIDNLILEFSECYHALATNREINLPQLDIQYRDFATWQRRWSKSEAYQTQVNYWTDQLAHTPKQLQLSIEMPQSSSIIDQRLGNELNHEFSEELSQQLYALAQSQGTTLYITLLSVFNLLLARYSNQSDICVGTSIANRPRIETEALLGYFVNTLVMRSQVDATKTFEEFLSSTNQMATDAYEHQDLPFDHLIDILNIDRKAARSPIFQVLFVMNNGAGNAQLQLPNVTLSSYEKPLDKARFDLTLRITERKEQGTVRCDLEYNTGLYSHEDIQALLKHFECIAQQVCHNPTQLLSTVQLLNDRDIKEQISLAQGDIVDYNSTSSLHAIHQLFETAENQGPESTALVVDDESLTYRTLNQRANRLAHFLREKGVVPNSTVALFMDRSVSLVVGILAVLKAGGAYVPLDTQWPKSRLSTILHDCDATILLTESKWQTELDTIDSSNRVCIDHHDDLFTHYCDDNLPIVNSHRDAAYLIYTSGSTGEPKGVVVEHGNILNYIYAIKNRVFDHNKRPLSFASISTVAADLGNTSIYGALCFGGSLHLLSTELAFQADLIADYFTKHAVDVLKIVPSHLRGLLSADNTANLLPKTLLILGGENCAPDLIQQVRHLAPELRIVNHYGPTETTVGALTYTLPASLDFNHSRLPIGKPLSNYQTYILDDHGNLCPNGMAGELCIGGLGVARGYHNKHDMTRDKFFDNHFIDSDCRPIYHTGDKVRRLNDGNIEFLGRMDQQIKIRGYRVELGDIEACIKSQEDVQDCAVCLLEKNDSQQLVAVVITKNASCCPVLIDVANEQLPNYMVPSEWLVMDELPLTVNGKLDRATLVQQVSTQLNQSYETDDQAGRLPETPIEQSLSAIWCAVLKRETVAVDDNFFAIGGDSIRSLQVIAKAKKAGFKLAPKQFFDFPTIAELATQLETASLNNVEHSNSVHSVTVQKAPEGSKIPLSFSQQRLWFLNQLQGPSSVYNIPMAVAMDGPLHRTVLEQSFLALVKRHPSLRTRFLASHGEPYQHLDEASEFSVDWCDFSHLPDGEAQSLGQKAVIEFSNHAFAIDQPGLFRVNIIRFGPSSHWLLVNCHHLIADGWSMGILVAEFCQLYHQLDSGKIINLPDSSIQYSDYSYWQHNKGSQHYQQQLQYWQQHLASPPALLALPTDFPRPVQQSYHGEHLALTIDTELTRALKRLAKVQGSTLYVVLLAAWQVLLHRYSGQDDICIGSPVANRHLPETHSLVGFFANTVVLRSDLSGNPKFTDYINKIKELSELSQVNQDVPFEHLVEHLKVPRDTSYSPLFQVMFAWGLGQDDIQQSIASRDGGIALKHVEGSQNLLSTHTSKFDLELALREIGDEIEGRLEFATDLFEASSIERMWRHFIQLLGALTSNANQRIDEVPFLLEQEQTTLQQWNDTEVDYSSDFSFEQVFARQVNDYPTKTAARFNDEQLTYQELDDASDQLAHYLLGTGVKPDDTIVVCQRRSLSMLVSLLGVLKAGAAYVPIDPNYPSDRVRFMLEDCGARAMLVDTEILNSALFQNHEKLSAQLINVESVDYADGDLKSLITHRATRNHLAYLIYTSGSTGKPKAVQVTRGNQLNFLRAMQDLLKPTPNDKLLAVTSLSFDIAVLELYLPLISGGEVILSDESLGLDGQRLQTVLKASEITMMQATPVSWKLLIASGWQQTTPLKVLCGGEAFPSDLAKQLLHQDTLTIWNLYGPTETTVWSSAYRLTSEADKASQTIPIGKPIANTKLCIIDANFKPVPIGVAGELCIGGDGVARGYLGREALTAERFIETEHGRVYRTGDLARYRKDGTLECLGRLDQQVKIRGYRIELGEIESLITEHKAVKESIVYIQQHHGEQILVAYVVANTEEISDLESHLKQTLRHKLPDYMLPSGFLFLPSMPLTPNGKIDRKALPELTFGGREDHYVAPRNKREEQLCEIWCSLLGVEKIGINDNFFELGGHSLLAAKLKAEIETQFERDITLMQMFSHQTIQSLAEVIDNTQQQFNDDDMDWMEGLMESMEEDS